MHFTHAPQPTANIPNKQANKQTRTNKQTRADLNAMIRNRASVFILGAVRARTIALK